MKRLFLLFFLLSCFAFGQENRRIDSLFTALSHAKVDTSKVNLLNSVANEFLEVDNEKCKKYAFQAVALAKQLNFSLGEADAYSILGKNFHGEYNQENAILYYNKAIAICIKFNDKKRLGTLYYRLANIYNDTNDYASALENYFNATKIYEELKINDRLGVVLNQISSIYRGLGDYEKSKEYLDRSTKILSDLNDEFLLMYNYINYAQLYERTDNTEKVAYYATKTYELASKFNNKNSMAVSLFALGMVHKKKGQYEEALKEINKAINIFEELSNFMGMASAYNELGVCYLKLYEQTNTKNYLTLAKNNFEASNKIYLESNLIDGLPDNYLSISKISEMEHNYKSALDNYQLYSKYKDSILSESTKETIKNLEDKRSIEIRDKEIAINKLTIMAKEKQQFFLIAGISFFAILGGMLFYQNRTRRKNNKRLRLLNQELDESNKVKARFFGILNHDLRSPVANLIHFLHLKKENPELLSEENKTRLEQKTITAAENLLISMEDILLWSKGQMDNFKPNFKGIEINELFNDLSKHFGSEENVEIRFENPQKMSVHTDENYLKTIMRNLTGNAIKALTATENPQIVWKAKEENGKVQLSIADNGPGSSDEKFRALYDDSEVVGIKTGLGLHLIRDLAKAINCEIDLFSQVGKGTTIILKFS